MPVLKQISATALPSAPKPRPQKTLPSASTRQAVAPGGAVSAMGRGSVFGVSDGAPGISAKVRPVAVRMAGQCLVGMALDCRHLRMASVPTPQRSAAASEPPKRAMISSTLRIRRSYPGKNFPGQEKRVGWEKYSQTQMPLSPRLCLKHACRATWRKSRHAPHH